ncbi:hypothetical protein D3C85_1847450 [compost metagenome]
MGTNAHTLSRALPVGLILFVTSATVAGNIVPSDERKFATNLDTFVNRFSKLVASTIAENMIFVLSS